MIAERLAQTSAVLPNLVKPRKQTFGGSSSSIPGVTEISGRRNAAAHLALRRALHENPSHLVESFDARVWDEVRDMATCSAQLDVAETPGGRVPVRSYLRHTSRSAHFLHFGTAGLLLALTRLSAGKVTAAHARGLLC